MTLIELLATIGLMATAVVGLLGLFSTVEIGVSATGNDAQLAVAARTVGDLLQSEGIAYVTCTGSAGQPPNGITSYQTAVINAVAASNPRLVPAADTITVVAVSQADSDPTKSFHTVSGVPSGLQPINGCSSGPASGPDFGVQQIQFRISSGHNSLTRVVYKRWN